MKTKLFICALAITLVIVMIAEVIKKNRDYADVHSVNLNHSKIVR